MTGVDWLLVAIWSVLGLHTVWARVVHDVRSVDWAAFVIACALIVTEKIT